MYVTLMTKRALVTKRALMTKRDKRALVTKRACVTKRAVLTCRYRPLPLSPPQPSDFKRKMSMERVGGQKTNDSLHYNGNNPVALWYKKKKGVARMEVRGRFQRH